MRIGNCEFTNFELDAPFQEARCRGKYELLNSNLIVPAVRNCTSDAAGGRAILDGIVPSLWKFGLRLAKQGTDRR